MKAINFLARTTTVATATVVWKTSIVAATRWQTIMRTEQWGWGLGTQSSESHHSQFNFVKVDVDSDSCNWGEQSSADTLTDEGHVAG